MCAIIRIETHSSLSVQLLWQFMAWGGHKVSELAPSLPVSLSPEKLRFRCIVWCMYVNLSMYESSMYVISCLCFMWWTNEPKMQKPILRVGRKLGSGLVQAILNSYLRRKTFSSETLKEILMKNLYKTLLDRFLLPKQSNASSSVLFKLSSQDLS